MDTAPITGIPDLHSLPTAPGSCIYYDPSCTNRWRDCKWESVGPSAHGEWSENLFSASTMSFGSYSVLHDRSYSNLCKDVIHLAGRIDLILKSVGCNFWEWSTSLTHQKESIQRSIKLIQSTFVQVSSPWQCYYWTWIDNTTIIHSGLRAVTSLLLGTMLRPVLGNPTSSVPIHTHRNNEMLFLGSRYNYNNFTWTKLIVYFYCRPGRKLANIRKGLEMQLLLQCGERSSLYDFYQSPILSHVSSPYYPPLYTRNVERDLGNTMLSSGQMSLNSLWPIMLMQTPLQGIVVMELCALYEYQLDA